MVNITREQANQICDDMRDELCKATGTTFNEVWQNFFGNAHLDKDNEEDDGVEVIGYTEDGEEITNGFRE